MECASLCQYFKMIKQWSLEETTFHTKVILGYAQTYIFHDYVKELVQRSMESSAVTILLAGCWRGGEEANC
jgi:hypothetical protein